LRRFMVNVCKCVKTSPQSLTIKELAVASWQHTISHFLFHHGISDQKHDCRPPPTLLFCFPDWRQNWKVATVTQQRWSRQNHRWCQTLTEYNFQSALKNGRSAESSAELQKKTTTGQ
jgi:hypothetical protein